MAPYVLQRCAASDITISILIHVIGLLFFAASLRWLPNITNPLHAGFGGSYQFLTIIALTISTITFGLGFLADFFFSRRLWVLKNTFLACATPLELLVSLMYWSLRAIDKRLVVPPGHELPVIPDLGFHAIPAIMLTLDLMLLNPPWRTKASTTMILSLTMVILYWGWMEYCFTINGWYPYPLLELLSPGKKVFLLLISATTMTGITTVLQWVHGRVGELRLHRWRAIK
ncbi:FAR-17a/AIG1-like protein [Mariannaea sp. PMI_226]|nr:FAR-17a/AIG1-like protein [Mariannaea sp. PMI_226]